MRLHQIQLKIAAGALLGAALVVFAGELAPAAAPHATPLGSFAVALRGPVSVAAGRDGLVYAVEPSAGRVVTFDAFGRVAGVRSGFAKPIAIAVDSDNRIYLGEEGKRSVTVYDAQWQAVGQLGQGMREFALPNQIAVEANGSRVYVCDGGADVVAVYEGGKKVLSLGGSGAGPGQFNFPAGVCLTAQGEVAVLDQGNDRVTIFNRAGLFLRMFSLGEIGTGAAWSRSGRSQGMTADGAGRIYVADSYNGSVKAFDGQGSLLATIGEYGMGPGRLRSPVGLAIDGTGRLLVASANNSRIELFGLDSYVQLSALPSSQVVAAGEDVSFSVTVASPGPPAFQWRAGTNVLSDGGSISGSTTPTLCLRSVTKQDSGNYSVTVSSPAGSFASPGAVLKVLSPPLIRAQPAGLTVIAGQAAAFSVSASGDELAYQWQREDAELAGETGTSLVIPNAQPKDIACYSVLVRNSVGAVSSEPAQLSVVVPPASPQIDSATAPAADGTVQLIFRCEAGFNYAVDVTSDLVNWSPLAEIFSINGYVEYQDTGAAGEHVRLYRMRWLP